MLTIKGIKSKKFVRYCNSGTPLSKKTVTLNNYKGCILGDGFGCGLKRVLDAESVLKNDPSNIAIDTCLGNDIKTESTKLNQSDKDNIKTESTKLDQSVMNDISVFFLASFIIYIIIGGVGLTDGHP